MRYTASLVTNVTEGLWQEAVLQNVELAGPSRVFLAEPAIAHDQELCVLAVDGGRLQLAAGRSLVMERLLMLDDEPELVTPSDFDMSPTVAHVMGEPEDADTRGRNTERLRTQRLGGDPRGRTLLQAMRETVRALAHGGDDVTAIFRADFFVRWERGDEPAALWINEVEHGFNAACLVGWFGQRLTTLALRAWIRTAEASHAAGEGDHQRTVARSGAWVRLARHPREEEEGVSQGS